MAEEDKYADEKLTDDELDKVAGGGTAQTGGDEGFLAEMGYVSTKNTSGFEVVFNWGEVSKRVDDGWSNAGVTCVTKFGAPDNLYYIGGNQVSRKEAFAHVLRQKGFSENAIANYDYDKWNGSF